MPFKVGSTVHVEFDGKVTAEFQDRVTVIDPRGNLSTVQNIHVTPLPPYENGKRYIDADGDIVIFHMRAKIAGGPGWQKVNRENDIPESFVHDYDWASRPLFSIGNKIEE